MSKSLAGLAVFGTLILSFVGVSCGPSSGESAFDKKRPVVAVAPVQTRPYEDGYGAGFDLGQRQAAPHGRMAKEEEAARLGREQASGHTERTARWERGFVEGYLEGYRNVVTGKK